MLQKKGSKKPIKILFVGNSYTYYNSLPQIFKSISNIGCDQDRVDVKMIADSGATLERHWLSGEVISVLQRESWDYVVLQEQSRLGEQRIQGVGVVNSPEWFHTYVRLFDQVIQSNGARTVLMLTWAHQDRPAEQVLLNHAYYSIAKELDALVVPVGLVWEQLYDRFQNQLSLFCPDGGHPSSIGSLVAASVFYVFFFHENLGVDFDAIKDSPFHLKDEISNTSKSVSFNEYGMRFDEVFVVAQSMIKKVHTMDFDEALDTSATYPEPPNLPPGKPFALSDLQGLWTGPLSYYSRPATLTLNIQEGGNGWHADITLALGDGSIVSSRWSLADMQSAGVDNDMLFIVLEATHDFYTAIYTGNALVGIVRGDHANAPEANRYGSWRLERCND